ncbi:MAG: hypothetical protein ACKVS9_04890 [Phycisphaerae bacterium]
MGDLIAASQKIFAAGRQASAIIRDEVPFAPGGAMTKLGDLWRLVAGHKFFGPNNATDLWHVKKVNPQSMVHLTEKPVELAARDALFIPSG